MENFFKFNLTGGPCSDETSCYEAVVLKENATVQDLINHIIQDCTGEWGYIDLKDKDCPWYSSTYRLEYRWGKIVSDNIPDSYKNIPLPPKLKASGGWSRMDYIIPI